MNISILRSVCVNIWGVTHIGNDCPILGRFVTEIDKSRLKHGCNWANGSCVALVGVFLNPTLFLFQIAALWIRPNECRVEL